MRTEQVLSEGRKCKRFQKYPKPVEEGDESDEENGEKVKMNISESNFCHSRPPENGMQMAVTCVSFAPIPPGSDSEDESL